MRPVGSQFTDAPTHPAARPISYPALTVTQDMLKMKSVMSVGGAVSTKLSAHAKLDVLAYGVLLREHSSALFLPNI